MIDWDGGVWTTRDGCELPIHSMTRDHAANIVAMLRRGVDGYYDAALHDAVTMAASARGEMASDIAEGALDEISRMSPLEWLHDQPLVRALLGRAGGYGA